nr:replication protein A 70 kDa DNA-binding subunit B-like [Ipomoea batatas]
MSMLYVLAKDISPQSYKKAIRLRLIRTYIVTEDRNKSAIKSQECLFHDIEGTYVHASIHVDFIDQFSNLLKEGKVYAVKNFVVVSYYYQYKTTQHKYMMRFNQYTTIERHRRKGFPSLLFRIKPIEDLLAGKVEEKQLIDVIGRVVEFYSPKDKVIAGFPTQLVDFLIEDSKGNRIKCTLWDEHVPAVMPFFNNHVDGHLIVLLQLCCAKIVDSEVRISSSYTTTKVLFNLDCQEFADFRNSFKVNCSPLRSISVLSYGHSANNFQSPMVVSAIRDLYERAKEGYYYVPGTIVSIESGKKWFYNSCRKPGCFKSLILTETYYFCDTCKTNWAEGNVRYKVIVRVLDKTSDAPFVLWDKDCFDLLGITAYDLKTKYSMAKMQVPAEFEQLRNKSMVFRINLKNEHIRNPAKPISVLSVIHNEELEAQYCPSMVDDHDELSRMVEEDADDLESDESESGDEAISQSVQANLKLKGVANDQDEVDTGAIKICLLDQFSSSQNLKKSRPLLIKQEKN